jgi:membrane protein YqaA with SNARE-associated domain
MEILTNLFYKLYLDYGLYGILIVSFLAATILSLSSEVVVSLAFYSSLSKSEVLLFATIGNSLACLLNYFIGYYIFIKFNNKFFKIFFIKFHLPSEKDLSYRLVQKYNIFALLASWLPIIGDSITILVGYFKFPFLLFSIITTILRFLRYYVIYVLF